MMRNIVAGITGTLIVGAVCLFSTPARADETLAIVGGKTITLKDFNEKYEEVQKSTINPPSKELFLEDLVRYEMGVQEAQKKNLEQDPIVKERFRQELYKALIEREIGKKIAEIKVGEDEMKTFYQKNPEIRTSHILIEFKPDATQAQRDAARERAQEIFAEVQKSKRPFEELVALYTDDVLSKKTGGDVGWQSGMTLVPNYYETIQKMKIGEVKGLVETQYGYHIVKVTGRHSFDEANKRQIRAAVFDAKRKILFDEYFAKLKKSYPVKLNKAPITK